MAAGTWLPRDQVGQPGAETSVDPETVTDLRPLKALPRGRKLSIILVYEHLDQRAGMRVVVRRWAGKV